MAIFSTCKAERLTEIPNAVSTSASNLSGMAMANGITYCVKTKNREDGIVDKFTLYQYDDYESIEKPRVRDFEGNVSYGMTYNPLTKKVYMAAGKKVVAVPIDNLEMSDLIYSVAETSTQAITYYEENQEILMANSLNTDEYFCFLVGKFAKGVFTKTDEFYVEKANYVEVAGYTKRQDIYYNGTNGLFIVTNYSDTAQCRNRILRVSMKNTVESYNGKTVYAVDEVIDINFDTNVYALCTIESLALDKYGRMVLACNAAMNGVGKDSFFRVTDRTFEMKTEVNFICETEKILDIPGNNVEDFHFLTGMTMHGDTVYFVKTSSNNRNGLYKYDNATSKVGEPVLLEDVGKSFGMTYYNNSLYIAHRNCIAQYTLNGIKLKTFACKDIDSIAHLQGNEFLVMKRMLENGKLRFGVWDLSGNTVVEKDWFTVENKGYATLQDIYYHPSHGLFIATQADISTCKNIVLRVDMTYYMKNRSKKKWNGSDISVASRWNIDFDKTVYAQCYLESLHINSDGEMLVGCNARLADKTLADKLFKVTNLTFRTDGRPGIFVSASRIRSMPSKAGRSCVPACLAKNGRKVYCITTNTQTEKDSYFMETKDYRNENFVLNENVISDVAHCNGGAYFKDFLYSCNYSKTLLQQEMGMFQLVGKDGKPTDRNKLNSNKIRVSSEPNYWGAIAHYKDDKFLLVNYANSDKGGYAKYIRINIGRFVMENGEYKLSIDSQFEFTVENPMFISNENGYLQDAHYEPGIGLFIGGFLEDVASSRFILRIDIDEDIKSNRMSKSSPCEFYFYMVANVNREVESMVLSEYGELLVSVQNGSDDALILSKDVLFEREL